ncbi:Six-hairpin glycosidase-like protein [Mycena sanguinolenta]|uniref:Six-hairpin glycosidase-like protein n=1 Tax=Mycena sanguinolenta TaxID=230812 RepID=A0A8H7DFB7_9AGAR|nr:Six-hairpin glycosidase-like protein [Mycena sanguinolenta]
MLSRLALALALVFSSQLVHASNYSTWMALSIMSRSQGVLASSNDTSALLQAGVTQKAFTRLIEQYPSSSSTPGIAAYLKSSVESVAGPVTNATKDLTYAMDRLSSGNALMNLYAKTGNATYRTAYDGLRASININSRNAEGGMWYFVYPNWSYLDGMYSLAPFYAYYDALLDPHNGTALADMMHQLDLLWTHCAFNASANGTAAGLLVHGYDDSKTAVWADPVTGASPHVWGRSLGWYTMALVDTLEILPARLHPTDWALLHTRFGQLADAIKTAVDPASGAWWQILDQPARAGNYIESSGTAMFVYALLKGVRLGYLQDGGKNERKYTDIASRAYEYIVDTFVVNNGNGTLGYNGTVTVCSLNSTASYEYYVGQPILYNSPLGSAPFVLASLEYESLTGAEL